MAALVAQGYTDKQIAGELKISRQRVSQYIQRIADAWQLDGGKDVRVLIARRLAT